MTIIQTPYGDKIRREKISFCFFMKAVVENRAGFGKLLPVSTVDFVNFFFKIKRLSRDDLNVCILIL